VRLRKLAFAGLTRFNGEPVRIDFDQLGPGLIALVGRNGAGKSTALEATPALLYKAFPTRPGSLYNWTHGDSFIEADFVDGGSPPDFLKVRLQVDAAREKTEGYVFRNGEPVTNGKADDYEKEIRRLFGTEDLFLASVFSAQSKVGSLIGAKPSERKKLFAELLGLGHLEALAGRAKERRQKIETALAALRREVSIREEEVGQLPALTAELERAREDAEKAAGALQTAREEEAAAISALERAKGAQERLVRLEMARQSATREYAAARDALSAAESLGAVAQGTALKRRQAIGSRDPDVMRQRAQERHDEAAKALSKRVDDLRKTMDEAPAVQAAEQEITDLRAEEASVKARIQGYTALHQQKDVAAAELAGAERRLEDAENAALARIRELRKQAGLIDQAPCSESLTWTGAGSSAGIPHKINVDLSARCPLLKGARDAKLAIADVRVDPATIAQTEEARQKAAALDDRVARIHTEEDEAAARLGQIVFRIPTAQRTAALAEVLATAARQLRETDAERTSLDRALEADVQAAEGLRKQIDAETASIQQDLTEALLDADEKVKAAKERLRESQKRLADATKEHEAAESLGGLSVGIEFARVNDWARQRSSAEASLRTADENRGKLAAAVEHAATMGKELEEARKGLDEAALHLSDWTILERALGRDGVQALEIDAAGPEVSRLCNDLLTACYGPRFSVHLETLREKKTAPGEFAETFEIRVYDADRGIAHQKIEGLSGGEGVIVAEAIGLGLSIFNARKNSIQYRTLWRDETAGALDPENAQHYIEMLRRAMDLGGFEQCLFVAHSPEVWERADVRLMVADGRITPEAA
jgi:exonuclease SbcC